MPPTPLLTIFRVVSTIVRHGTVSKFWSLRDFQQRNIIVVRGFRREERRLRISQLSAISDSRQPRSLVCMRYLGVLGKARKGRCASRHAAYLFGSLSAAGAAALGLVPPQRREAGLRRPQNPHASVQANGEGLEMHDANLLLSTLSVIRKTVRLLVIWPISRRLDSKYSPR